VEILARAVIVRRGRFLVAHGVGAGHTYLPGGHAEPGEGLRACLVRELREELGVRAEVGRYLGAVEHGWSDADGPHEEVSHFFVARVPGVEDPPVSMERGLEFLWLPARELARRGLEPAPLRARLAEWPRSRRGGWWSSTIEPAGGGAPRGARRRR
jgi:8-oxo-dGTP pyrophosphatase MutT (NUDIX family)